MPFGLKPSGLLMTKSATTAAIHAIAMFEYKANTCSKALNTSNSINTIAILALKTTQTTRPGWLCVNRAKKLDHASEPA